MVNKINYRDIIHKYCDDQDKESKDDNNSDESIDGWNISDGWHGTI